MYTQTKKATQPRKHQIAKVVVKHKEVGMYSNLSVNKDTAYMVPVKVAPEPLYAEIPEHLYAEIPERKDNLYEEISESVYHDVQNYPVADYSLAAEGLSKVVKKTPKITISKSERIAKKQEKEEEKQRKKEEKKEEKREREEKKKREKEQSNTPKDILLRIGDGIGFNASSSKLTWGINTKNSCSKWFLSIAKNGDRLWFVESKNKGRIVAVATFTRTTERILGPLIPLTLTNEELGWDKDGEWDTEVNYTDLYDLTGFNLNSEIKGAVGIRPYTEKCKINLPTEYSNILRYSKITQSM